MNILLNNYCNLNCEYCFANRVLKENRKDMSIQDFNVVLDFLEASRESEVRLLGGEPTLHYGFSTVVLEALRRPSITRLMLFTNGLYSKDIGYLLFLAAKHKQVNILFNVNSPEVLGSRFKTLRENIRLAISDDSKVTVTLGINFYQTEQDYSYIIDLAKEFNIKSLRWSLVVPNDDNKKKDVAAYFQSHVPLITRFLISCRQIEAMAGVDCNSIPICLLSESELRLIAMINENALRTSVCQPVIDIKPDLKAIRCFGMSSLEADIRDYPNVHELRLFFKAKVDATVDANVLFDECKDCASYKINGKSCACLAYREGIGA